MSMIERHNLFCDALRDRDNSKSEFKPFLNKTDMRSTTHSLEPKKKATMNKLNDN